MGAGMVTPNVPHADRFDVAVVGASFAGASAALYLGRARRSVVMFDSGLTRNRSAAEAHGFPGQDGRSPESIRMTGRQEALSYPTVEIREDTVVQLRPTREGFRLEPARGAPVHAARVIFAFGMRDLLPSITGLAACWGRSAMQCPYCHGYELADRPTGVLMTGEASLHQLRILPDWSADLTLFTNGHVLDAADTSDLTRCGLRIVGGRVTALEHRDGALAALHLDDGSRVECRVLYLVSRCEFSCDLAAQVGCETVSGPFGPYLVTDDLQQTTVANVFAAGDITRPMYGSVWAAADGVRAGIFCHQSLRVAHNPYGKGPPVSAV